MLLNVVMLSPAQVLFEGTARNVIVPGEAGAFELLPYHKPIVSRLISGHIMIEDRSYAVRRGILKFEKNTATIIVEEPI